MLKAIIALFRPQSKPQPTVTSDPKWTAYKAHLRGEKLRARREKAIGFVPAILEHLEREYRDGQGL